MNLKRARRRAARRQSLWNLLLFAFVWPSIGGTWWALFYVALLLQRMFVPEKRFGENMSNLGEILMVLPLFFPALPLGMVIGNLLVWLIPPARAALDAEAAPHPGTDFFTSQKQLALIAGVLLLIAVPICVVGLFDPFSR